MTSLMIERMIKLNQLVADFVNDYVEVHAYLTVPVNKFCDDLSLVTESLTRAPPIDIATINSLYTILHCLKQVSIHLVDLSPHSAKACKRELSKLISKFTTILPHLYKFDMEQGPSTPLEGVVKQSPSSQQTPTASNMTRYYNWSNTKMLLVVDDDFVEYNHLITVVKSLRKMRFSVKDNRDAAIKMLDEIPVVVPATPNQRFPSDKLLVNITTGSIADILQKMRNAYDVGERMVADYTGSDRRYGSLDDAKLTVMRSLIRIMDLTKLGRLDDLHVYGLYTQRSFEAAFNLTWR